MSSSRLAIALVGLVMTALPPAGRAESLELTHHDVEYMPSARFEETPSRSTSVLLGRAGVKFPILFAERVVLLPGLRYEVIDFGMSGFDEDIGTLHDLALDLAAAVALSKRLALLASIAGGFASEGLATDHFIVTGSLIGSYELSSSATLGAGLAYDGQTGSITPLPVMSIDVRPLERFRIKGVVPAVLDLEYRCASWLTAGVRETLRGNRYHLDGERYALRDPELAYSVLSLGPKFTFSPMPLVHIDVQAAVAAFRRFDVFSDGREVGDDSLEPGPVFGLRVWLGSEGWDEQAPRPKPERATEHELGSRQ